MMIERRVLHTTFEEELRDCVLGQEVKRFPGSNKNHHDFHYAVFFFSELMFANGEDVANPYGVPKAAYTNTHSLLGLIGSKEKIIHDNNGGDDCVINTYTSC